jgi:hypothetical protein
MIPPVADIARLILKLAEYGANAKYVWRDAFRQSAERDPADAPPV